MSNKPKNATARIRREEQTIEAMLRLYCNHHHNTHSGPLCSLCIELKEYALKRLHLCPFQEEKPTCGNCLVHCYKKDMRQEVKKVMRYAGPRLFFKHPILTIYHLIDSRIKPKQLSGKKENI